MKIMLERKVKQREYTDKDRAFITSSFLKSLRHTSNMKNIPNKQFFNSLHDKVINYLKTKKVIILCNPLDYDQIYAYMIYDDDVVYFSYVKQIFRRLGKAKYMLKLAFGDSDVYKFDYPFKTFASEKMKMKPYLNINNNPLLV